MRLSRVKNVTAKKLVFPTLRDTQGRPLSFAPGESKELPPATVKHPAVSVYIGRGLQLEEASAVEVPKEKVLEPVVSPAPQPAPVVKAPVVEPEILTQEIQAAPATPAGLFSAAPGVTEKNEALLDKTFATIEELAASSVDDLVKLHFTKTAAKKLLSWAAKQSSSSAE